MASRQVENQETQKVIANLNNQTPYVLHAERYLKWSNPHLGPLPPAIYAGRELTVDLHASKGAVVYIEPVINEIGTSRAWVVAWDTLADTPSPNKVYVTCGSKYEIEKMTDDEILKKLNESTSPDGSHTDPITKATVQANLSHSVPDGNALKASFGISP